MESLTDDLRVSSAGPAWRLLRNSIAGALFFLFGGFASAHTTPEPALQAQEMLGEQVWSQVVHLTHDNPKSRYPKELYATVFEFDNVLWFYTSTGTQPIERSRNRTGRYRDNLLPLLRTIERNFELAEVLPASSSLPEKAEEIPSLKNGCVIESIYSMERMRAAGTEVKRANLLLYSTKRNSRRGVGGNAVGHAVLVYQTDGGVFVVDPPEIHKVRQVTGTERWEPELLAASIEAPYGKTEIREAFFVPVNRDAVSAAGAIASGDGR